jgi:tRNA threonylcarbamoyladenosine biosynthesis protein TsaE
LTHTFRLPDAAATEVLAVRLVAALPPDKQGWIILLQGELGAGKSTLARAMLHEMGHSGTVPSPTYTLVEPYELQDLTVYHIDLYRIAGMEELEYLGWSDLRDGLILLEWPERVPQLSGQADLRLMLEYEGNGRLATLAALSPRGADVLHRLDTATY